MAANAASFRLRRSIPVMCAPSACGSASTRIPEAAASRSVMRLFLHHVDIADANSANGRPPFLSLCYRNTPCASIEKQEGRSPMNAHHRGIDRRNRLPQYGCLRRWLAAGIALVLPAWALSAGAADWKPASQVEIVVPNSPGGGNDAVA